MTLPEAQAQFRQRGRKMTFGNGQGYPITYNVDTSLLLNGANPQLEGKITGATDSNGVVIAKAQVEAGLKNPEGGITSYLYPRPGQTVPVPKMVFVRSFAPWNVVMSYGLYVDDLDADVNALLIAPRGDRRRRAGADGAAVMADRPRHPRRARAAEEPDAKHCRRIAGPAGRGNRARRRDRTHGRNAGDAAANRADGASARSRAGRNQAAGRKREARRPDRARQPVRRFGGPAGRDDGVRIDRTGSRPRNP